MTDLRFKIDTVSTRNKLNRCVISEYDMNIDYADYLLGECKALKNDYEMGGRKIIQFGEDYLYSKLNHIGRDKPQFIKDLIDDANSLFKTDFNSVLMNVYQAGKLIGIGKHSDSESGLEANSEVLSISLGSPDFFYVESNERNFDEPDELINIPVYHGKLS